MDADDVIEFLRLSAPVAHADPATAWTTYAGRLRGQRRELTIYDDDGWMPRAARCPGGYLRGSSELFASIFSRAAAADAAADRFIFQYVNSSITSRPHAPKFACHV